MTMFNLIMFNVDWTTGRASVSADRFFEYTDDRIIDQFRENGSPLLDKLMALPALFMMEEIGDETAYVGQVTRARISGRDTLIEFALDRDVPPLQNGLLYEHRTEIDMPDRFEFSRNHWAVKDVDLYRFLLWHIRPRRQRPTVFQIPEHEGIEPSLVSAMMPFDGSFAGVYQSIQDAAGHVGLRCRRADDIWENPAIIQDVVALIDRSRLVVCDCTGRNPNVFYEAGIAHTLGRDVILITQNEHDIPFDLRHLRYIRYLNNAEGRAVLTAALQGRMQTIIGN